jgi:chitin synthase
LKLAEQIKALESVLDSFGNAKTFTNPNASRHGRYLELRHNERGRIFAAQVLTFGFDKTLLNRLTHEESTYRVFYRLLAGTTSAEQDYFNLEGVSDYAPLASSRCYHLPSGPFSDGSIVMAGLRLAMRTLGFKPKNMTSIFTLLVTTLLLGNLQFTNGDAHDVSAHVSNPHVLDQAARLLGVSAEELGQIFTTRLTTFGRNYLLCF